MKRVILAVLVAALGMVNAFGQESGNRNYGRSNERRTAPNGGIIYGNGDQLIEAYVLLNAVPEGFLAVFGTSQVAPTALESNQKVSAQIEQFLNSAEKLGVARKDTFVDFITQNRVYSFAPPSEGVIRETLSGFETKKTVAIRYKDRALLEKLLAAAAGVSIFDLIKVDYVLGDMPKIRARLFEEASRIIKQKEENYIRTLGLGIRRFAIVQETYKTFYPAELYQTYNAFETGAVDSNYGYGSNTRVIRERKSSTSYLEPLDPGSFDSVINTIGVEPVVQCTLYLKVAYTLAK